VQWSRYCTVGLVQLSDQDCLLLSGPRSSLVRRRLSPSCALSELRGGDIPMKRFSASRERFKFEVSPSFVPSCQLMDISNATTLSSFTKLLNMSRLFGIGFACWTQRRSKTLLAHCSEARMLRISMRMVPKYENPSHHLSQATATADSYLSASKPL
jgi:hypothetical protein